MELLTETVPDAHIWWRIADPGWADPLDPDLSHPATSGTTLAVGLEGANKRSPILGAESMEVHREPSRSRRLGQGPDQAELDALVASIVKAVDPERIILFGSGARGTMNDESDLDLLVVKDRCRPRGTTTKILDAAPWGRWPLHVIVVWPEDLVRYRSSPWHVIPRVLRDGRTLYVKAADGSPGRRGRSRVAATGR